MADSWLQKPNDVGHPYPHGFPGRTKPSLGIRKTHSVKDSVRCGSDIPMVQVARKATWDRINVGMLRTTGMLLIIYIYITGLEDRVGGYNFALAVIPKGAIVVLGKQPYKSTTSVYLSGLIWSDRCRRCPSP